MAVVREDTVKVNFDVDYKPLEQVDSGIDKLVQNTQKMAGSGGIGKLTQGFNSLAAAAKKMANTKLTAMKNSLTETKNKLTEGEKGAKGLANAMKNVAKASLKATIKGAANLTKGLGKALAAAGKLALKLGGITMKGLLAGIGAGVAGLGALGAAAIKGYAEFEQLKGGVETLFGASSGEVVKNANNAFKTAGLSANQYMETVTSFSASLLQSVGGDTAKAASLADQAIIDMSDNANKMGTDMGSIQNAYQGFAKQNYTMLDNLKLGYGGTKEEMQRLLTDAEKLSGQKFDISSYADIVSAIHVVQTEMGITGTTAKEASSTIQGSFNAMKGAWTNFLTGMADPNQDFDQLVGNLVDSIVTFGENLIPRIQVLAPRLVQGIAQLAQALVPAIPGLLNDLLPVLVDGALSLVDSLVSTLETNAGSLTSTAVTLFMKLIEGFLRMFPQILSIGGQIFMELINGLTQQLPSLLPMAFQTIVTLVNGITQNIPQIIQMGLQLIFILCQSLMDNMPAILQAGVNLLLTLVQGVFNALPQLIALIPQLFFSFVEALMTINWLDVGLQLIKAIFSGVWEGIKSFGGGIVDGIKGLFGGGGKEAGAETVNNLASGINASSPTAVSAVTSMNTQVNSAASDGVSNLVSTTSTGLEGLTTAFDTSYTNVQTSTTTAMGEVNKTIASTDLSKSGVSVMQGLNSGMESMIPTLVATAQKAANAIKQATDGALDIHSPSRVMQESGENAGLGQVKGLRNTIPEMKVAAREVSSASIPYDTYSPDAGTYYNGGDSSYTTVSPQFNLTISGTQDDRAMARRVKRYVAEAISDTFESLERKSYSLREA